jgi:hypothetical protein
MQQPTAPGELAPTDELPTVARTLDRWRLLRLVLGLQGLYYLLAGLWPLLHLRSFVWVFGEKRDLFQLDVTSALIIAIGVILLLTAARRPRPDGPLVSLGAASAAALALAELKHAGAFRPVTWVDFAVELLFAVALAVVYITARWHERRRAGDGTRSRGQGWRTWGR